MLAAACLKTGRVREIPREQRTGSWKAAAVKDPSATVDKKRSLMDPQDVM